MRRLLCTLVFITALQVSASAQDTATVSGILKNIAGQRVANVQLKITPLVVAGQTVHSIPYYTPKSDSSGNVSFTVLKNSTINVQGNALRFTGSGSNYEIKDDDTISLDALVALASVPTTGVTVYDETTPLSGLFGTFKFVGAGVTATRSSMGIVTITIPGGSGSVDWADILNKPSTFAPTTHAAAHQNGGADEIATATPGANAIPKAGGTGKLAAGWIPDLSATYEPANSNIQAHIANTSNPHGVTKAQVGLGNVANSLQLIAANNLNDVGNAAIARTNLGVAIGSDVQAWDPDLDTWATKTPPGGAVVGTSDAQTLTNKKLGSLTSNGFVKTSGGDGTLSVDTSTYLTTETDPIVKAINGIVKSNGSTIAAAVAGTDYENPLTFNSPLSRSINAISCSTCTTNAAALTSNLPVIGAGGNATAVGTRSGNTTEFATSTGTKTTGKQLQWDASGNVVASLSDIGGGSSISGLTTGTIPKAASSTTIADSVITESSGKIGIGLGSTAPPTSLTVGDTGSTNPRGLLGWQASDDAGSSQLGLRKNRGTFASPTVVTSGDNLGRIRVEGYDGSAYVNAANIIFGSTGTVGTGRVPSTITFQTLPNTASPTITTALTIGADQSSTFAGNIIGSATGNRFGTATTNDANADTMFSASAAGKKPVVIQAAATPTVSPFVVQQSDATPFFQVQTDGGIIVDQRTGSTFSQVADFKFQGTTQGSVGFNGQVIARVGFNGGGGFFTTDGSGNVVALGTITAKHALGNGTSPTVTGNGSSNGSIAGKDWFFKVTVGTGTTTSITVTFGTAYSTAPACVCCAQTTATPINVSTSTTAATLTTAAFTAGEVLHCTCGSF